MSSEEDKMPIRRENTLAPLEKVPEELMDKIDQHAEAKRVADLPIVDRLKDGIQDVTTQISSQVENIKGTATTSTSNVDQQEKEKTQEKEQKFGSPKPSASQKETKKSQHNSSLELKHKLESGEKIKASELASEFIHFIQEESQDDKDQKKPEAQKEAHHHESFVHIAEEGVKTLVRRLSQTLEDVKEKLSSSREGSDTGEHHHHSFKEVALEFVHELSDNMTLDYDQEYIHKSHHHKPESQQLEKKLAKFIPHHHAKPADTSSESKPLKADEIASTQQIRPDELKGFTKVESQKSESVSKPQQQEKETQEEEKPLTSSTNPFDILMEDENLNVVAGEGIGQDITNKATEESSSFKDKAKGKIENATAKISHKVDAAKGKVSSTLGHKGGKKGISSEADKENAPQVS